MFSNAPKLTEPLTFPMAHYLSLSIEFYIPGIIIRESKKLKKMDNQIN